MPIDFRAYVQSKGRARHSSSHYVVLMPNNDHTSPQKYEQYKITESKLKNVSTLSIINNYIEIKYYIKLYRQKGSLHILIINIYLE